MILEVRYIYIGGQTLKVRYIYILEVGYTYISDLKISGETILMVF